MGNVPEKQPYMLINNVATCETLNDNSTETIVKSITKPTNSTETIVKTITKPNSLAMLIKAVGTSTNITDTFKDYDENTILDYYKTSEIVSIFKQNNSKSLVLAHALPANNQELMFKYAIYVPVELIIIMSKNINFNAVDKNSETFLYSILDNKGEKYDFDIKIKDRLEYVCTLLENIDTIDVNLTNTYSQTFFEKIIQNRGLTDYATNLKFIQLLEKRNYNFNKLGHDCNTFLTQMLISMPKMVGNFSQTLKLKSFDITTESRWLHHLLTNNLKDIHNYIYYMFQRDDYNKLILKLYRSLYIDVWGDCFIIFLKKVLIFNKTKCIACLNYKNKKGNTVIHIMARMHDKQTLQYCVNTFQNILTIEANNDEKTPLMLYNESSFKTLLK